MSDPTFSAADYIKTDELIHHLVQNRAIDFQLRGDLFSRDEMQANSRERHILLLARDIILNEGERILDVEGEKR